MKLKNLFPVLVEKCLFSCNRSARLFLSVVMIAMFAAPSTALAQGNGQAVATVQSLGQNPVEYTDLEAAFAAAKNNDEIKLLADCALAADDTHTGKLALGDGSKETDVVLDLNGHTISGTADELITVTANALLRIIDGGTGGSIVTTGAKCILSIGALYMSGGSVTGATCGVYSQGAANIGGGTVSGGSYALYIEQGVANIGGGTFVATGTDGIGIESENANGFYILGLPTFDCTVADISLAKDLQIEFAPGSFDVPAKKIRVKVDNEAPYTFTSNYEIVTDADGDQIYPEDMFVSADYGEDFIGFRYDSSTMFYEAAIAGLTKVTFPAGTSTYFDQRALALYGTNDNLKFYGIKGLSGSTVQLAEFKSKKFGENSTVIVSNTSGAAITAEMVVAFEGPMASGFMNAASADLDLQEFLPIFLEGTEEALTEISVPEDYEVFGFSDNSFVLLGSDATAAANSGWLVAQKSELPAGVSRLSILWPDGTTTGCYLEASWISLADGPFVYNGQAQTPAVIVKDGATDVTSEFDVTYSNNKNAGEATAENAPTVTVTAKATSTSYKGSATKTFTINKKPITVTAENKSMAIGGTEPVLTYTVEGLVEGETVDIELQRTKGNNAGIYDITLKSISGDDNYSVTFVKGTFTIKKEANISKKSIGNPENLAKDETCKVTLLETEYAPSEKELAYLFWPVSGVTVVAVIKVDLESTSGNEAIYKVTENRAEKLIFGDVEWKESGALLTRPANLTFSGADVDASKIHFTNIKYLKTENKMILVSGFGNSAGVITGSAFTVASGLTGEGHLYFESGNIDYIVTKGTEDILKRDPREDGEYDELDGSKTTIQTDEDGTQHITNTKKNDDGSITVTDTYIYEDGSIAVKETVTNAADGSTAVKETVTNADGSMTVKETVTNADGSTIETATTRVKNADGSITENTKETVTNPDGTETTTENTKETVTNPDGSIEVRQTTTDGEGYQSGIEMSVSADGSDIVTLTSADAEGSETVETVSASQANDDGSTTHTEKVTETTKDADGKVTETRTTTTESTATSTEHADGSVTDTERGMTRETCADGSELVTGESIRETTTHADGSSVENVSETPDLGDSYCLDDAGRLTPDPEGAEGDNYKEIVNFVSGFIQDNTDVNGGDADDEDQVSVLLGGAADAGNVWLNTNEETDAEGEVIKQDASLTVKHTGSAGGSGKASFDSKHSAQIAIGAGALTSGSNSGKQSDSGKFGSLSWIYSNGTLTIKGKGTMKQTKTWLKYKTKIKNVRINNGVTNIASNAFSSHTKLSEVYIANSVTNIGSNAFKRCKNLTSVNIARGYRLIKIGQGAFDELNKLSKVTLPSSVTHIAKDAFKKCKKISVSVRVPAGKVLSVKIKGVEEPQVIKPTSGMADITSCLFKSNRNSSRALVLKMVVAGDGGGTSGARSVASGDGDDSGADGDDSGDDGDDSGDGGDTNSGGSSSTQNMGTPTVTFNFAAKGAADNGAAYDGNSKVTAGKNSLALTEGGADRSGSGSRAAAAEQENDEIEIVSGQEYKILRDGYIVLNFYTPDADITVNSIVFRRPGDANNDGYVNAVDLVEMINAKNDKASERFNLTNADIDRDGQITQDDIDAVVKLIMEQTDEK